MPSFVPRLNQNVWTYSQTAKIAQRILGPKARVWRRNNQIQVGYQTSKGPIMLGEGPDYQTAFQRAFVAALVTAEQKEAVAARELALNQGDQSVDQPIERGDSGANAPDDAV